jgi:hypothetical protein
MMVYFRSRIGKDLINSLNQKMVKYFTEKTESSSSSEKKTKNHQLNQQEIKES